MRIQPNGWGTLIARMYCDWTQKKISELKYSAKAFMQKRKKEKEQLIQEE